MFTARKPLIRPLCLIAFSAAGIAALGSSIAQERVQLAAVGQAATPPALNPRHPDTYVVQNGDTLWDIAAMFLRDPWYWPEIWQINPQVENPHLIFPGDVLRLSYLDDGRPVVQVERGGGATERLSPRIREYPLEDAISTVPYETLRAFLSRPAILDAATIESLPYVVALREGLMGSTDKDVYVRGTDAAPGAVYSVVHIGEPLVDPDDERLLGYEAMFVGRGRVDRTGDPATMRLIESTRETVIGDRLLTTESVEPFTFMPRAPEEDVEGRVISVVDGVSLIGQYQVVAINRGERHGLAPGHVLRVFKTGKTITDPVRGADLFAEKVRLPDEPGGTMMLFRTFDRMSYGLIMEATEPLEVLDTVRNP